MKHYLGICAIAKDEDRHIREWLHYHALLGVEHVILFDNESRVPLSHTLAEYIEHGFVTVVPIVGKSMQMPAYAQCLERFGQDFRWLAFIDLDEFLFPVQGEDLRLLLSDYEEHGGLGANWCTFGSSGHVTSPDGMQIDNYRLRYPQQDSENMLLKSIVQPRRVSRPNTPHHFDYPDGHTCVNEDRVPVVSPGSYITAKRLRVNHYFYRSQEDYVRKAERGRADNHERNGYTRTMDMFLEQLDKATERDSSMASWARKIRGLERRGGAAAFCELARSFQRPEQPLEAFIGEAARLLASGDPSSAAKLLCTASLHHEHEPNLLRFRAMLCRTLGKAEQGVRFAERAVAREPSPDNYFELMQCTNAAGMPERASGMAAYLRWGMERYNPHDQTWPERIEAFGKCLAGGE